MSVDLASWVLISVPTWLKLVHTVGANLDERPVDEIWVGSVTEFDGKPLQSVAKGEVDLDSEDDKAAHEAERQEQERDFADLLTWLQETLSDHVKEVRLSTRLTESPACLITDTFGMTPALARMYRASGQVVPVGKRILELNPNHPLVTGLQQAHKDRGDDSSLVETAELLYGTALLAEGGVPEDPAKFAGLLADRLGLAPCPPTCTVNITATSILSEHHA